MDFFNPKPHRREINVWELRELAESGWIQEGGQAKHFSYHGMVQMKGNKWEILLETLFGL